LKPLDLLDTAKIILASNRSRPTMVSCRRAVSACYYALFHCLARECADLLIGSAGSDRSDRAWTQAYRSLDHAYAKSQCEKAGRAGFPASIVNFAAIFQTLQIKRHDADYDPDARFVKSAVQSDIMLAEAAIRSFLAAPRKDRRAFCAWVILRNRRT
jgi:hypothetical protein